MGPNPRFSQRRGLTVCRGSGTVRKDRRETGKEILGETKRMRVSEKVRDRDGGAKMGGRAWR